MKKTQLLVFMSLLFSTSLMAATWNITETSGRTATDIQTDMSTAVAGGHTDITLQFAKNGTWGASGSEMTLSVPAGVTKLTLTYNPATSGNMPLLYLGSLSYADGLMTGGLTFNGIKVITTSINKYLFSATTTYEKLPRSFVVRDSWIEGHRAVVFLSLASINVDSIVIANSTIKSTASSGVLSTGNGLAITVSKIDIQNNTFIDCNAVASSYFFDHRTSLSESTNFNFSNNTVYYSTTQGNGFFRLSVSPTTAGHYTISNNIFSSTAAAANFKFCYAGTSYTNIAGSNNIYSQSFTGITNPITNVSLANYNVAASTLFVDPTATTYNFTINDASFTGKSSVGNANCYYPLSVTKSTGSLTGFS